MLIRTRLALLLAVPTLALAGGAGFVLREEMRSIDEAERVVRGIATVDAIAEYVHALQRERGRSALALGNADDSKAQSALRDQRSETDQARHALAAAIEANAALGHEQGGRVKEAFDALPAVLKVDDSLRADIDGGKLQGAESNVRYTALLADLLGHAASIASGVGANESYVVEGFRCIITCGRAKEFLGQERATLTAALNAKAFAGDGFGRYAGLVTAQETYFSEFRMAADEATRAKADQVAGSADAKTVADWRKRALSGNMDGAASTWLSDVTRMIDLYRELEQSAISRFGEKSEAALAEARTHAGMLIGGVSTLVIGIAVVGSAFVLRLGRHLRGLAANVARIGQARDLAARVEVVGKDEVAAVGHAFNGLLEATQRAIVECRMATTAFCTIHLGCFRR